ncbi:Fungalysin metallopeptidase-domain-containing protein [Syncephalis fuscata]|nr:Fungalysin metallopeptidase-domain-containing protein [Syncephalis fuscata]
MLIIIVYVFIISIACFNVTAAAKLKSYVRIANFGPKPIATLLTEKELHISPANYTIKDKYYGSDSQTTHIYLQQLVDNIEITNARLNINVNDEGRVIAYGNGFCDPLYSPLGSWLLLAKPAISGKDALIVVAKYLNEPWMSAVLSKSHTYHQHLVASARYIRLDDGTIAPVWNLRIAMPQNYFEASVAADGSIIHQLMDWTGHANYRAVPIGHNNPVDTPRQLIVDPQDKAASPLDWLEMKQPANELVTSGNNVIACVPKYEGLSNRPICTPITSNGNQTFDYSLDLAQPPEASANASVTNLFYVINSLHDIFYVYGFDEIAGNDPVIAMTLDDTETNNSAFIPAPEGESPELHIYRYDSTGPRRDATFDNSVLAHEYTHGVTFRLVGGPSAGGCLGLLGPSGISEGSGDFVAMWLELKPTDQRTRQFELGKYAFGVNPRTYSYSTDMQVNPTTYGLFNNDKWAEPHKLGEIWATVLYEMHWNLVDKLGFDSNIRSANLNRGNTLSMQLFISSLKLMKCQPSYIDARDAILQAEKTLTKGAHSCALWKAFAKRGLGNEAVLNGTRNITIPGTDMPTFIDNIIESYQVPQVCNTTMKQ